MIQKGKMFARRPWDAGTNGLTQHFDNVHLEDVGARGFYLAMHTGRDFLKQNNVACDADVGYYWEALVLENFSITGVKDGEGVYITDGMLKNFKPDLTIKHGVITGLNNASAIHLDHLELDVLNICDIKTTGVIVLEYCKAMTLKLIKCNNLKFITKETTVAKIELWQCSNIDVSAFDGVTPVSYGIESIPDDIFVSLAANVLLNGTIYSAIAANIKLTPKETHAI